MGLFDHFPYTNVHELNLDWVLSMMKALEAEWEAFTAGNSLTFADPMLHDISKSYAKNTIVLDGNGNAYVSLQAVPVGVGLQNGDYWLMVFDYEAFIEKVNKNFTARYYRGSYRATAAMAIGDWLTVDDILYKATAAIAVDDILEDGVNITHFTLEDFIKAFMQSANQLIQQYKNDIDASELLYRQQLAQDIANTTASLQAQLDLAISGATVDSEVINARLGANGTTYNTLGDAIRGQFTDLGGYTYLSTNTYAGILADCDDADLATIYLCNFAANDSRPAHFPTQKQVTLAMLITMNNTIKTQYLIDRANKYMRFYSGGSWQSWILVEGGETITSGSYSTILADLNSAQTGTVYVLNFAANSSMPANMPDTSIGYHMANLITAGDIYKSQFIYDTDYIYHRFYASGTWTAWTKIYDYKTPRAIINQTRIDTNNYSSLLPDLNSADNNTFYTLNFGTSDSKPANVPDASIGYPAALLFTSYTTTYYRQILINYDGIYTRFYAGSWAAWTKLYDQNYVLDSKICLTSNTYSSYVPDLDTAPNDELYIMNFSANANMPAHMPDTTHGYTMAIFLSMDSYPYGLQIIMDPKYFYFRFSISGVWQSWNMSKCPEYIKATPSTLIGILKKYNGTGINIILDNGEYDLYQMYMDYYGNDFWTNYQNYDDVTDPFYKGLYLENINVIGSGNTVIDFSGTADATINQYFSLIAPAGKVSMSNLICDTGTHQLRYAVHDDFDPITNQYGTKIEYHNCIFKGTSYQKTAIGAGFRNNGMYVIDNCIFDGIDNDYDISYHAHNLGTIPSQIVISNCLGSSVCSFGYYGSGTDLNQCIVNNSQFKEINTRSIMGAMFNNMNLIKYLCVETG